MTTLARSVASPDWFRAFTQPRSLALVGARPGSRTLRWLKSQQWPGTVSVVHPSRDEVDGVPCVPCLSEAGPIEAALLLVPGAQVPDVLAEAVASKVRAVTIYASEVTGRGVDADRELVRSVVAGSRTRVIGPNALGVLDLGSRCTSGNSSALGLLVDQPGRMRSGNVAIVSQSGGLGDALMVQMLDRRVGVSVLVQTGNEGDIGITDVLHALRDDERVQVVACYVEGVTDPRELALALRALRDSGRAVAVLKVGQTARGRHSALTHTGALTGDDEAFDAMCRALGVVRAADFADLVDIVAVLSAYPGWRPKGRNVAVVSASGGTLALLSEASEREGVELARLGSATIDSVRAINPAVGSPNPMDLTGHALANPSVLRASIAAIAADPGVDALVYGIGLAASPPIAAATTAELSAVREAGTPTVAFLLSASVRDDMYAGLAEARVPVITEDPGRCFRALAALLDSSEPSRVGVPAAYPLAPAERVLSEGECRELLAGHGVQVVPGGLVDTVESAVAAAEAVGYPVLLKIDSPLVPHRTELGAVVLDLRDESSLCAAWDRLKAVAGQAGLASDDYRIMVESFIGGSVELLVAVRATEYGPLLTVGTGGTLTELLADACSALCPLTSAQAVAMLGQLRVAKLLQGFRGQPPFDVDAAATSVAALSELALEEPWIAEIEINPLLVLPMGRGALAADALARVTTRTDGRA